MYFFRCFTNSEGWLQMIIAQSFAYVERFWAPVLESVDKNLLQYGFGFWFWFFGRCQKIDFKNRLFAGFWPLARQLSVMIIKLSVIRGVLTTHPPSLTLSLFSDCRSLGPAVTVNWMSVCLSLPISVLTCSTWVFNNDLPVTFKPLKQLSWNFWW